MKERLRRMNQLVQREISRAVIEDMSDPRCKLLTISAVRLSSDLKFATVYCGVIGSEDEKQQAIKALDGAKGFIQRKIAENVNLRFTPLLRFELDTSVDESYHINNLLKKISDEES